MLEDRQFRGGKASTIFSFPLRRRPRRLPRRGHLFWRMEGGRIARQAPTLSRPASRHSRTTLFTHHVGVFGRLFEKAALDHPVDLFLKFVGLVTFDADELGHQPVLALLRSKIAQHLVA